MTRCVLLFRLRRELGEHELRSHGCGDAGDEACPLCAEAFGEDDRVIFTCGEFHRFVFHPCAVAEEVDLDSTVPALSLMR